MARVLATQALNLLYGPDSALSVAELCLCSSDTQKLVCPDQTFQTGLTCEGSSRGSKAPASAEEMPGSSQVLFPLPKPRSAPGQHCMEAVTLGLLFQAGDFPDCGHQVIWLINLYPRTCPDSGQTFYRQSGVLP